MGHLKKVHFGSQNRLNVNVNRGFSVILCQDEFGLTQIRLVSGFYHASLVFMFLKHYGKGAANHLSHELLLYMNC